VHKTHVAYEGTARASYNEARMTPVTLPTQTALETQLWTGAGTTVSSSYSDYWGTLVSSFDIQAPHHELSVTARAVVETGLAPAPSAPLSWARLHEIAEGGRLLEYLSPTPRTTVDTDIAAWVQDTVEYVPGSTEVQTSAQEAWSQGQGVCQDIAHLTVALLREVGLPARYVSGYLHPAPEAELGDTVTGESHAWVEYWTGEWVATDPTNQAPVGESHVVVARGRDYADVPPLKGIYHGAPSSTMDVTVEVTRRA
jgi:transglutaminase-like putative cysteine protease